MRKFRLFFGIYGVALLLITMAVGASIDAAMFHTKSRAEILQPSVFFLYKAGKFSATGFSVLKEDGEPVIITNYHVCRGQSTITASKSGYADDSIDLPVLKVAPEADLCLLGSKDTALEHHPLKLDVTQPYLGQKFYKLGNAKGIQFVFTEGNYIKSENSMILIGEQDSEGSCLPNEIPATLHTWFGLEAHVCVINPFYYLSTTPTFPGDSGSPVVNEDNNVIGIVSAGDNETHFSCIVPASRIHQFINGE